MQTCCTRRGRGFTLIELVVVITIIAIASVMIIPEMKGTFQDALHGPTFRVYTSTDQVGVVTPHRDVESHDRCSLAGGPS